MFFKTHTKLKRPAKHSSFFIYHAKRLIIIDMNSVKSDFSQGDIKKTIVRLALPLVLAQIVNGLYNIVDRVFIGQLGEIGRTALTGVGVAAPVIMITTAFALLWGLGGTPFFSIERGKGDTEKARQYMGNSFAMLIITAVVITIIGLLIKDKALFWCGASEETFPYANTYLTICLLGSIFSMVSLGMNSFISAQGFPRISMMTIIIGAVINLILDPIFIYVLGMGVLGAAIATVISQLVSAVWVVRFLTGPNAILRLTLSSMSLKKALIVKILGLGTSEFVMRFTTSIVYIAINASLLFYGGDLYVTVGTVINSLRDLMIHPIAGFASGAQPFLSYNYGANRPDRVHKGIKFMGIVCISLSILTSVTLVAFPIPFIRLFNSDPALIEAAVPALRIFFVLFGFLSLQMVGQYTFVGLGMSKQAIFFSIWRKVIILIPLMLILPRHMGVMGIFWAEPVSDTIGGLCCFLTMYFMVYRKLKKDAAPFIASP